jgi:hypothetical protein
MKGIVLQAPSGEPVLLFPDESFMTEKLLDVAESEAIAYWLQAEGLERMFRADYKPVSVEDITLRDWRIQ